MVLALKHRFHGCFGGENLKLKEKIKNWIFKEEIEKIKVLEIAYKDQIEWCQTRANDMYRVSERARITYEKSEKEVEECRRLITQLVDIGVDVGFHTEEHSWAVVCIAGKQEYVKFLPLETRDSRDVLRFLKQFEYSRQIIDSPIAFKGMLKDRFL